MPLSGSQARNASIIYGLARQRGLNDARARELVAASYAESGLNPTIRNRSSGATGLFQLLSSGYVNTANRLGGVTNPRANTLAILPNYASYWRAHPGARPGEAARDVERSGEGAGFYAGPLNVLRGWRPSGAPAGPAPAAAGAPVAPNPIAPPDLRPYRQAALQQLMQGGSSRGNFMGFLGALKQLRTAAATPMPTPAGPAAGPVPMGPAGGGPAGRPVRGGKVIGTPYQGTHAKAFNVSGGSDNWESENANDIRVPVGTPIYAVANGTIGSSFGSLGSGGRFAGLRLHLQGAKNEWYYAHLSKFAPGLKPGVRVRAGQLLGYSGEANGVPHLHIASAQGRPPV